MTQASQSGGGRSTGKVNKNTDQLGGLADKATDQARNVAQHVEERGCCLSCFRAADARYPQASAGPA